MISKVESQQRFDQIVAPGNVVIVTGAALGIGRALVQALREKAMRVIAIDVDGARLDVLSAGQNGAIEVHAMDVSDARAWQELAKEVGSISLLINNAASRVGQGFDAPIEDWQRAMDVNLWGAVYGVQAFLPQMKTGAIVNVGSKQGITNPPGHPVYNMTKAALRTYSEQLEHNLRQQPDRDVTAHLLVPGWTTTGTAEHKAGAWRPEQVVERLWTGMAKGAFYILCPDNEVTEDMDRARVAWTAGDIIEERPPLSRWHPDWADYAKRKMGE